MAEKMKGVVMELEDCAFPLLNKIIATTDYKTAFEGVEGNKFSQKTKINFFF